MITLEKFEANDIQRLIDWIPDADFLLQWSGPKYDFPLDHMQVGKTLAETKGTHPSRFMFKAILNGVTVGHIELMAVDYSIKHAVLARVLIGATNHRGKGWGKTMIQLVLHIAFHELGLDNIDLGVFKFNTAAIYCYGELGFKTYKTIVNTEDDKWTLFRMNLNRNQWQG